LNAAQYFDHWNIVQRDLLRAVALLEDDDLSFQPSENYSRSVGDILLHIINLQEAWIHFVIFRILPKRPEVKKDDLATVAAVRERLNEVFDETMSLLSTVALEDLNRVVQVPENGAPKMSWILWHVFEQQIHHRGELFLCLSLLDKERPTIDRPE
jgi:uncharacterized damage-inducible protein DinB